MVGPLIFLLSASPQNTPQPQPTALPIIRVGEAYGNAPSRFDLSIAEYVGRIEEKRRDITSIRTSGVSVRESCYYIVDRFRVVDSVDKRPGSTIDALIPENAIESTARPQTGVPYLLVTIPQVDGEIRAPAVATPGRNGMQIVAITPAFGRDEALELDVVQTSVRSLRADIDPKVSFVESVADCLAVQNPENQERAFLLLTGCRLPGSDPSIASLPLPYRNYPRKAQENRFTKYLEALALNSQPNVAASIYQALNQWKVPGKLPLLFSKYVECAKRPDLYVPSASWVSVPDDPTDRVPNEAEVMAILGDGSNTSLTDTILNNLFQKLTPAHDRILAKYLDAPDEQERVWIVRHYAETLQRPEAEAHLKNVNGSETYSDLDEKVAYWKKYFSSH